MDEEHKLISTDRVLEKQEKFATLSKYVVHPPSVRLLPQAFCLRNHIVILGNVNPESMEAVDLGMLNPDNKEVMRVVADRFACPVRAVKLNHHEVARALNKGFAEDAEQARAVDVTEAPETLDPRVIELVNRVINDGIMRKASDIHIERHATSSLVRYRIDGMLYNSSTRIPLDLSDHFISRLMIMANLDISEKRMAQFGKASVIVSRAKKKVSVPLRISVIPGLYGEEATMRILDPFAVILELEELGFRKDILRDFRELINDPQGLLLVSGPTGCGKTTTLYSTLQELNSQYMKILTAEDPVEFNFDGICQKQISPAMDYFDYARAFLRMDPDVVLIGEIRDEDTAMIGIRAAQTGHLVLSTLHTNDAVMSISRMVHLKVDPHYIATSLIGALSQRLVRKICAECKTETKIPQEIQSLFPEEFRHYTYFKGEGCNKCREIGYSGRIGLFELLVVTDEISDMVATGESDYKIRQYARQHGMKTIAHDAVDKIREGATTVEEILRVIPARHLVKVFEESEQAATILS